ncbi:MAG: helix-hairpin-helix domain-containing protein [Oscillospiraceae bacterium]|nr:helix-hairpin-helix domain-containing protein [Oscillospiraceae bacterium]
MPMFNPDSKIIVPQKNYYENLSFDSDSKIADDSSYSKSDSTNSLDNKNNENLESPFNLNTATSEQLQTLSGIGEVKAKNIIAMREELGGFSDLKQLLDVSGIGQATYEKITPYLYID